MSDKEKNVFEIVVHPDPRLRKKALPIEPGDQEFLAILDQFIETMYVKDGVGLAGPQVGISKRFFVIDINAPKEDEERHPMIFINPEIISKEGELLGEEGCLSVPGIYDKVVRATNVTVKALDRNFKPFTLEADEMLAVALQHENDHLNGVLFIDYLSPLKQQRITSKMLKLKKKK